MVEQWLGPKAIADTLGISAKALRVYERMGLIRPRRTQAGWRLYGGSQVTVLHQILALKRLGLSLRKISELLADRSIDLDRILALQISVLDGRRRDLDRALAALRLAREKLAMTGSLSMGDLISLTRETMMSEPLQTDAEWHAAFGPIIAKHYSPEEIEALGRNKIEVYRQAGYDEPGFQNAWRTLIEEARTLHAANDLGSPRACELVRRWNEMTSHFTNGNPEIVRRTSAIWAEACADPALAPRLPITPEIFSFIRQVAEGMRQRGELAERA